MYANGSFYKELQDTKNAFDQLDAEERLSTLEDGDLIARCGSIETNILDLFTRVEDLEINKVDKISGKGLSEVDFTSALKTKLDGISSGATANDSDSNLKNRANHTGTQATSTITGLDSTISNHDSRITALENWKNTMPKRSDQYTGTTDANGDITITFPTSRYTNTPKIGAHFIFNNNNHTCAFNIKAVSASSVTIRLFRTSEVAVLLGGSINVAQVLANTAVVITATEY